MRYSRLGRSGLEVSEIGLGCYAFGDPARGSESWTVGEERSRTMLRAALEAGITFFDTANVYSAGHSEEILGRAVADYSSREEVVIATKVWAPMRRGPNAFGLSRVAILREVDASLRRLGTDYIDLYQIHRADPSTPIEETMQALHDVVRAGKVRYLGASSMPAWEFARAQHAADLGGWTRFVSMQNHYNLLYREEEREMLPLCADQGVGVIPWSPLARGRLTRPWDEQTARAGADPYVDSLYRAEDRRVVETVRAVAAEHGVTMAQVALAWLIGRSGVTAPILGVTDQRHLHEALAAARFSLDDDARAQLEAGYRPRAVDHGT